MTPDPSRRKKLVFLLTIVSGLIILLPSMVFQDLFAQGDHGRDLYAFQMTADGALPYRDYIWVYGPLMPFYYAPFFKFLGYSISNILLAETILKFLSGVCFYLIMAEVSTSLWPFLATIYFWSYFPFFFYTYNHAGGILCMLIAALCLVRFIKTRKSSLLFIGLMPIFLLGFIKLNFGLCLLLSYFLCVLFIDKKYNSLTGTLRKRFILLSLIGVPVLTALVYLALLSGLPGYIIKQCLPYARSGDQHSISPWEVLPRLLNMVKFYAETSGRDLFFTLLTTASAVVALFKIKSVRKNTPYDIGLVLACLSLLALTHFHEYMISGVPYRLFWSVPFLVLIVFILIFIVAELSPKLVKAALMLSVLTVVVLQIDANLKYVEDHRHPKYFLGLERGGILLGNSPEWIETVERTTFFLKKHLSPGEEFLALPYEPLYYYLLNRRNPTYQMVYFDYMNIPPEQDARAVEDIKNKNIRWVIFSNRIISQESSLGSFGESNSPLLAKYLEENFSVVGEFGSWDKEPGWNTYHGIRILKKN